MHDFHMIDDIDTIRKLLNIILFKNYSIGEIYNYIINQTASFIDFNHYYTEEHNSAYQLVNFSEEKPVHFHIFMEKSKYKKLKLIHHNLDTFSIAQLIRLSVDLFLEYYNKYGEDRYLIELKKLNKKKRKKIKKNKIIDRSHFYDICKRKSIIAIKYNKDFSPITIKLLE